MGSEPDSFDLDAAWVRRAQTDVRGFMEALAVRLEGALPGRVSVVRQRDGLLSRESHVREITVEADAARLKLAFQKGKLLPSKAKIVRGVVIGNSELTLAQWLAEVRAHVAALAGTLGDASDALRDFL